MNLDHGKRRRHRKRRAPSRRTRRRRGPSRASPPTRNDFHDAFLRAAAVLPCGGICARGDRRRRCAAQSAVQGVPNAMQGFSQNRDQPIQIEAASLEMRDKKKEATFAGNVKVVQGDTTMTSKTLVVFYDSAPAPAAAPAANSKAAKSAPIQSATPRSRRQFVDPPAGGAEAAWS